MTTSSRKPEKATITNIDTKDKFEVLFNPTDYSLSKTNNWTKVPIRESDVPRADFSGGDPTELKVQLFVDTRERGEDARTYVNKIVKLTEIAQQSDGYRPPRCMFSWGPVFSFVSVITSLTLNTLCFERTAPRSGLRWIYLSESVKRRVARRARSLHRQGYPVTRCI